MNTTIKSTIERWMCKYCNNRFSGTTNCSRHLRTSDRTLIGRQFVLMQIVRIYHSSIFDMTCTHIKKKHRDDIVGKDINSFIITQSDDLLPPVEYVTIDEPTILFLDVIGPTSLSQCSKVL